MRGAVLSCALLALTLSAAWPAASAGQSNLTITNGAGIVSTLTPTDIAALPVVQETVSFGTATGPFQARFAGPLLWTVLTHLGVVDPAKPRRQAGQMILVTGQDGYAAVLAMGEISPAFEGKAIILAESMNGDPLGGGHLRLVVPGDRKGARNVRDVVRIVVSAPR